MRITYSPKFARKYKKLPNKVKDLIKGNEEIFLKNPFDKKLKTHKLSGKLKGLLSFSINHEYRIIFEFKSKDTVYLHSVGTHRIYR